MANSLSSAVQQWNLILKLPIRDAANVIHNFLRVDMKHLCAPHSCLDLLNAFAAVTARTDRMRGRPFIECKGIRCLISGRDVSDEDLKTFDSRDMLRAFGIILHCARARLRRETTRDQVSQAFAQAVVEYMHITKDCAFAIICASVQAFELHFETIQIATLVKDHRHSLMGDRVIRHLRMVLRSMLNAIEDDDGNDIRITKRNKTTATPRRELRVVAATPTEPQSTSGEADPA